MSDEDTPRETEAQDMPEADEPSGDTEVPAKAEDQASEEKPATPKSRPSPCTRDEPDVRVSIEPGTKLMLDFPFGPKQMVSTLVGYQENNSLIVRLPLVAGIDNMAKESTPVTIKYLHHGTVYGFRTEVIGRYVRSPLRFLFLAYPLKVERHNLRKTTRINCYITATAELKDGPVEGVIVDLSPGGASFASYAVEGQPYPQVEIDDTVIVRGYVVGQEVLKELGCKVRSISQDDRRMLLGLAFVDTQSEMVSSIGDYVNKISKLIDENES